MIKKINLAEQLSTFQEYWSPRIVGELNGQHVKLVKLKGDFVWHKHDLEDEMFYVLRGELVVEFRDGPIALRPGECLIIPRGVEHRPRAAEEVHVMLFEPVGTINTGNIRSELTQLDPPRLT